MGHSRRLCMVALVLSSPAMAGSMADIASAARDNPLAVWPLDLLSDTRDRPLFSLHRRPPPPPAPQFVAPAPKTPPPNIVLLAIVSDDGVAQAVVRTAGADEAIRARLGDEIAGWKLTHIEPRRLTLSSGDRAAADGPQDRPLIKRMHKRLLVHVAQRWNRQDLSSSAPQEEL